MVPHRVAPRVVKLFLLVMPLFLLAGCPKPGPTISKKDPAEITLPPKGSMQVFEHIERDLAKFDWGPAHDACDKCPVLSDVTIRYTGATKDISGAKGPANRRIVAFIENHSDQNVLHQPSKTTFKANTKYLMWVHSKNSKATWGFIELGPDYDANPKEIGLLKNCEEDWTSPTDDANFKACGEAHDSTASSGLIERAYAAPQGQPSEAVRLTAYISKPGWIGCDPDCCTGTVEAAF